MLMYYAVSEPCFRKATVIERARAFEKIERGSEFIVGKPLFP